MAAAKKLEPATMPTIRAKRFTVNLPSGLDVASLPTTATGNQPPAVMTHSTKRRQMRTSRFGSFSFSFDIRSCSDQCRGRRASAHQTGQRSGCCTSTRAR